MERLVVVGNGMAGMACVEQILRHDHGFRITVFGDETHVNYNRIQLSSVLAGEKDVDEIVLNSLEWYRENSIDLRLGVRITGVDPVARTVTVDDGSVTPYDKLLLAAGSSALIGAPLPGRTRMAFFCFRNLKDTQALLERAQPGLKTVVIGGGLLGLEAARGLQLRGADVTVVHLMSSLMERQLDPAGGAYLQEKIEAMGVKVLLSHSTTSILGDGRTEGISFVNGYRMEADLVVIAVGIRPNAALARVAGLTVNRGIVVNDYMETSDPAIFAVGEMWSTTASSMGWWRLFTNRARYSRPQSPGIAARGMKAPSRKRGSKSWVWMFSPLALCRTRPVWKQCATKTPRSASTRNWC